MAAANRQWLKIAIPAGLIVVIGTGVVVSGLHRRSAMADLTLFGNVDLRQVDLAFNNSERITEVNVQECDRVHSGQVLARLDSRTAPITYDVPIANRLWEESLELTGLSAKSIPATPRWRGRTTYFEQPGIEELRG